MTRHSIMEYAHAIRPRYIAGSKKTKGEILNEFAKVTGLHRKAAIRLLHRLNHPVSRKRCGRPPEYGPEVSAMLKEIWEASDRLCSKRLQPFLPEMIKVLRRHSEKHINAAMEAQLCRMSPSTIDRLLRPARRTGEGNQFLRPVPVIYLRIIFPSGPLPTGRKINPDLWKWIW